MIIAIFTPYSVHVSWLL